MDPFESILEPLMAVNLSVKNVPDDLAELLRRRAAANHRSLQRELVSILEAAVGRSVSPGPAAVRTPAREALTIEQVAELARKLFPKGTESSVDYIREMRRSR
jgi:plasmid stability protein